MLTLDLRSFGELRMSEHLVLHHDDVHAVNTEENPNEVAPVQVPVSRIDEGKAEVFLSPLSWNVIRFQ